jgi:hypothetical protein
MGQFAIGQTENIKVVIISFSSAGYLQSLKGIC